MLRATFHIPALELLFVISMAGAGLAQLNLPAGEGNAPTALVRSIKVSPPTENAAVEIITTRPMVPAISVLENPPRLVIDLPQAMVAAPQRIPSSSQPIRQVRVNQFQKRPPSVRVVVDLERPAGYSWDEAGNRLMIRLRPAGQEQSAAPVVAAMQSSESAPRPGSVVLASSRAILDRSVSAGEETAVLHLERRGEVRVCPGTTVSVTTSQSGQDMMLGISTGALEAHYRLHSAADSVLTPDFRIVPSGPGEFDYAVSADSKGNTCVRALAGNAASATVSEVMGEGSYQVKPSEQVVFRGGTVAAFDTAVPSDCGCPSSSVIREAAVPAVDRGPSQAPVGEIPVSSSSPETASLPATKPNDVHVQVDAPLVFRASDAQPTPAQALQAANLPLPTQGGQNLLKVVVLPPKGQAAQPEAEPPHRGFLGKLKGLFSGLFH